MTKLRGIRQTGSGWQVFVKVNGKFRQKHFPPDTPLSVLKRKRDELHAYGVLELDAPKSDGAEPFKDDCDRYLDAVKGMPTFQTREFQIRAWQKALGARKHRANITSVEIRTVLAGWAVKGPGPDQVPLSAATLNRYRTALGHLWRVLDGRDAPNPVRDVPKLKEPERVLRLPSRAHIEKAINAVNGISHWRLKVLMWTGWPASILMRVTEKDLDLKHRVAHLHPRRKGEGVPPSTLPLLPQAVEALEGLIQAKGLGPFSTSSLRTSLNLGCDNTKVRRFRPYDLRHWFLTNLMKVTKDQRAVMEMAMHSDPKLTLRYTRQAASTRARQAVATFATRLGKSGLSKAKHGKRKIA